MSEPMTDECSCTEDIDCRRCTELEKAGDRFLEYNDAKQIGYLLEERDCLRERVRELQAEKKVDADAFLEANTRLHKVMEAAQVCVDDYPFDDAYRSIPKLEEALREYMSDKLTPASGGS